MSTPKIKHRSNLSSFIVPCDFLDDFLDNYSEDGVYKGKIRSRSLDVKIFKPKTQNDAISIVKIYNSVYKGSYPYKEMLDPKYVYESFKNPQFWWGLFKLNDDLSKYDTNEIIGCFTIITDFNRCSAYMRGLNILPKFQGVVGVRELSYALIYRYFKNHPKIKRWYTEARTAHSIVQHLSYMIGARGCALLLGKDYFFDKKESDCFMLASNKDFLKECREIPKFLPSFLKNHYSYIQKAYSLHDEPIFLDFAYNDALLIKNHDILFEIDEKKYGYQQLTWYSSNFKDSLTALYTKSVKSIEKVFLDFHSQDIYSLISLLKCLETFIKLNNVEYCEIQVPASDIKFINYLHYQNWQILGYIPAWKKIKKSTLFEDVIVFGKIRRKENIPIPSLIKEHKILYMNIVGSFIEEIIKEGLQNIPAISS